MRGSQERQAEVVRHCRILQQLRSQRGSPAQAGEEASQGKEVIILPFEPGPILAKSIGQVSHQPGASFD